MFEYYVLNWNHNKNRIENFNIFQNWLLDEAVQKEVKKYLRSPNKYKYVKYHISVDGIDEIYYGFEALCKEINSLIMWQEWSRCEYEISVGEPFCDDCSHLEKWDCYQQCKPNIPTIARECIYQYKQYIKSQKD